MAKRSSTACHCDFIWICMKRVKVTTAALEFCTDTLRYSLLSCPQKFSPVPTPSPRKLAYGHARRKQGSCLEKEIMQGTMPGACRRGKPHTAWLDNIKDSPWKSQSEWQRTEIKCPRLELGTLEMEVRETQRYTLVVKYGWLKCKTLYWVGLYRIFALYSLRPRTVGGIVYSYSAE